MNSRILQRDRPGRSPATTSFDPRGATSVLKLATGVYDVTFANFNSNPADKTFRSGTVFANSILSNEICRITNWGTGGVSTDLEVFVGCFNGGAPADSPFTVMAIAPPFTAVTVNTNPTGLHFNVDGGDFTTPQNFNWATGTRHSISTTPPQTVSGTSFTFANWSNGASISFGASVINSFDGRIIPNSVIIPASSDGSIQIYASNTTDFLIDINGYFAPDDGRTGLSYYPITPCVAANSADSLYTAPYGPPTYPGGARSIAIPASPFCASIPSTAKGYALNMTANSYG